MRSFAVAVVVAMLCACSTGLQPTEDEVAASRSWLQLIDSGDYEASWQQSAPLFRGSVSLADWQQRLKAVREPLGELISREFDSAELRTTAPGGPDGDYLTLVYNTSYASKKSAVETHTIYRAGTTDRWANVGYFIR